MLSSKDTLRTGTTDCFDDRVFERCVRKHVVIAEYLFSILLCKAIGKDNTFNTIKSPVILNLYSKRVGGKMLLLLEIYVSISHNCSSVGCLKCVQFQN